MTEVPLPRYRAEDVAEGREKNLCPVEYLDYYRMPPLFDQGRQVFGSVYYNDRSRTRRSIDKQMLWACSCWKEKYPGTCTTQRSEICQDLLCTTMQAVTKRPKGVQPLPYFIGCIRRLVNDETTHERLKATVSIPLTTFNRIFHKLED